MVRKRKKANLYSLGGGFKEGLGDLKFNATDLGKSLGQGLVSGLGSTAGGIVGGLIGGGYESGAGNALNTIGDIGGMVPGPWGAAIGAGTKILGGLVNAAFGTKVDQAKLNAANQGTNYLNTFTSTATSFDDIKGPHAVADVGQVYKGGWFSKSKARRKNEELKQLRREAESFASRSVDNNVDNIAKTQTDNLERSFFAFGGPMGYMPILGAIDYEIAQRGLALKETEAKKSLGGPLHSNGVDWTNGLILVDQGGTHEENPNEGVQMGVAPDGTPNLVEEGEVIWNDYVFSDRVKVPEDVKKKYKLRGSDDMTFADAARKAQKPSAERPNDLIEMRSLEDIMAKLMMEQEKVRNKKSGPQGKKYSHGGMVGLLFDGDDNEPQFLVKPIGDGYYDWLSAGSPTIPVLPKLTPMQQIAKDKTAQRSDGAIVTVDNSGLGFNLIRPQSTIGFDGKIKGDDKKYNPLTALRYAPVVGAGLGVFSDLMGWTNKPDYSNADMILNASEGIRDISYKPIGDYLTYRPLDRLFYSNILGAQAGATRRNILNTSGGNRGTAMAGLLASDYNTQRQLGNLFREAEEYNLAQREKVATFNRATNTFNSEADLKAQIANAKNREVKIDAARAAANLRQAADAQSSAARNANLTNLFESLGNIGREEVMKSWINENPALYYAISNSGAGTPYKGARGGYLTIKRKK